MNSNIETHDYVSNMNPFLFWTLIALLAAAMVALGSVVPVVDVYPL